MDEAPRFPRHHGAAWIERDVAAIRARGDDLTFKTKHLKNRVNFSAAWLVVVTFVDRATGIPERVTLERCSSATAANEIVAALQEHESQRRRELGE